MIHTWRPKSATLAAMSLTILALAAPGIGQTFNVRDFGAVGDGVRDDTDAFLRASDAINQAAGGTLVIPAGIYLVGRQGRAAANPSGGNPLYVPAPILRIQGCQRRVVVRGYGIGRSILRASSALRFGAFEPTGQGRRFDAQPSDLERDQEGKRVPFWEIKEYQTNMYEDGMLAFRDNANVVIEDLELDGNLPNLMLGGFYGELSLDATGQRIVGGSRQCHGTGIYLVGNREATVRRVHTHHHGTDGIYVSVDGLIAALERDPRYRTPHRLERIVSEYNGRLGLAWGGGIGLHARDSRFNHNGRTVNLPDQAVVASKPASGFDIEVEGAQGNTLTRDGLFRDCEFINNASSGMISDGSTPSGANVQGGRTRFDRCTFWATSPESWTVFARNRGLVFERCRLYGMTGPGWGDGNPELATRFIRCELEDRPHPSYGVGGESVVNLGTNTDNVLFEDCRITGNSRPALFVYAYASPNAADPASQPTYWRPIIRNTTVLHRWRSAPQGEYHSFIWGRTLLSGVRFREEVGAANPSSRWYINNGGCGQRLEIQDVRVDGPNIGWARVNRLTGQIPATCAE